MPLIETLFDGTVAWQDWRGLSDDDLLRLDLVATEPDSLSGIIAEVRDGKLPTPEFDYNMKARDELVRCAFCRKPNHYLGVVAKYDDGARILVGRICAEKHLGIAFKNSLKEFDAALSRQSLIKRQAAVAGYCVELLDELRNLSEHPAVMTFFRTRNEMRNILGPLWSDLVRVVESGGQLTVDRQVPDYAAVQKNSDMSGVLLGKQRRKLLLEEKMRSSVPTKNITQTLGPLEGAAFFRHGLSVDVVIADQIKQLRLVSAKLHSRDVPSKDLTAAFNKLADIKQTLASEFAKLGDLKSALSQDNLARVATWLNDKSKTRYARGLDDVAVCRTFYAKQGVFGEHGWRSWSVSLPQAYHVPKPMFLGDLTAPLAPTGT
jgi:hypothetical protein